MPTSVLWVTLIAVWLFVLVPMVLRGRPQARKSTEAAANTRLVHRGGGSRTAASRTATRTRVAQRAAANAGEQAEELQRKAALKAEAQKEAAQKAEAEKAEAEKAEAEKAEAESSAEAEEVIDAELVAEDDAVDVADDETDVVEEAIVEEAIVEEEVVEEIDIVSAAELTDQIPIVETDAVVDLDEAQAAHTDEAPLSGPEDAEYEDDLEDAELEDAEYEDEDAEYEDAEFDDVEDLDDADDLTDEEADDDYIAADAPPPRELRGRGGYGPERLAEREAMQYRERQRVVVGFAVLTIAAIASAFFFQPWGIVAAVVMVAACATYLVLLRRAVREEHIRQAQRAARRNRQRAEDERLQTRQAEPTYVEPPARLRRPGGAIVLELDDEDPAFDHLPTYDFAYQAGNINEYGVNEYGDDEYEDNDGVPYRHAAV